MNICKKILNIYAILSITLILSISSPAVNADQLFYSPDSTPFNIQFKEWSAQWWQFVLSIPANESPLTDNTGSKCVVGQRGPVWFLVGTFGNPSPVNRACKVPAGKALFFPILNGFNANDITQHDSIATLRESVAALPDSATTLSVTVDGHVIRHLGEKFRIRSKVFSITLPDENIFGVPATVACPSSGTCSPAVDDGYYLMLKPLTLGDHTVHIIATTTTPNTNIDVTYTLTVVPLDLLGI
jgi:hypothetical protein